MWPIMETRVMAKMKPAAPLVQQQQNHLETQTLVSAAARTRRLSPSANNHKGSFFQKRRCQA